MSMRDPLVENLLERVGNLLRIGNVECNRFGAWKRNQLGVPDPYLGAGGEEASGDGAADALGTAGHDGGFAGKIICAGYVPS
jgi:hypothetical protein